MAAWCLLIAALLTVQDRAAAAQTVEYTPLCSAADPITGQVPAQCDEARRGKSPVGALPAGNRAEIDGLLRRGDTDGALRIIDGLLRTAPDAADLHYVRGMILQRAGQDRPALTAFDRALALNPAHGPALTQRVWALARLGQDGDLASEAGRALSAFDIDAIGNELNLTNLGGSDPAARPEWYDALIAASRSPAYLHLLRGWTRIVSDDRDGAQEDAAQAIELLPESAEGYLLRARVHIQTGSIDEALVDLDRARKIGSKNPRLLFFSFFLKQRAGDQAAVMAEMDALAAQNPQLAASLLRYSRRSLDPNSEQALQIELVERFIRGEMDELDRVLDRLLAIHPGDLQLIVRKALPAANRGDCRKALELMDQSRAISDTVPLLVAARSQCLAQLGEAEKAAETVEKAVAMRPEDLGMRRQQIFIMHRAGRYAEALAEADRIIAAEQAGQYEKAMRISSLYALGRLAEAAPEATTYLKEYGSVENTVPSIVNLMAIRLQREPTWDMAGALLDAYQPTSEYQDYYNYILARTAMHRNDPATAVKLLAAIASDGAIAYASADAVFRPLWNRPDFKTLFDPAVLARRSFNLSYARHRDYPDNLIAAVNAIKALANVGCRAQALDYARRLEASAPRYGSWFEDGQSLYITEAEIALLHATPAEARARFEAGLAVIDSQRTAPLRIAYANLLLDLGDAAAALVQADAATREHLNNLGYAKIWNLRAFAYQATGDRAKRDEALAWLKGHSTEGAWPALEAVGMIDSLNAAIDIVEKAGENPLQAQAILTSLHRMNGIPEPTERAKQRASFRARLIADARMQRLLEQVGKVMDKPWYATCALTEAELREKPMLFPLETAGAAQSSISPGQ